MGTAAGALGFAGMTTMASAQSLKSSQKRVLVINLAGGASQLETWDPKPGTDTGGPFRAIKTSVPGIHICELLAYTAKKMHRLALVRGLNTAEDDHGKGDYIMHTGRRKEPAFDYPHLGSVASKLLSPSESSLPGYLHITPSGGSSFGKQDAAFLGPRFASVTLANGQPPPNLFAPKNLSPDAEQQREQLRSQLNQRFQRSRRSAQTEAYTASFDQAEQFMKQAHIFDTGKEDPRLADRYGKHDFGRHCLMARRLLEHGATFVKVTHSNYDTHHENFDFHIEQLGEFDRSFATLIDDLVDRGLWSSTLVIVMSEFGRTPRINHLYGRDHWSKAWSVALGGCGIQAGAVTGKTNANGTAVTDREVHGGHLFHTYYRALGINPAKNLHTPDERPIPLADPKASAIKELLA
ncbi:MAG TPA: DUF1501 domain-containing protein [Gemmatales bacterium]|nr:DUF1501 domain-containing protein [Gemmatales bacterium]